MIRNHHAAAMNEQLHPSMGPAHRLGEYEMEMHDRVLLVAHELLHLAHDQGHVYTDQLYAVCKSWSVGTDDGFGADLDELVTTATTWFSA